MTDPSEDGLELQSKNRHDFSHKKVGAEFLSFGAVGAAGFLIDVGLFWFATSRLGWSIAAARCLSAAISVTSTWALNRRYVFANRRDSRASREYIRYVSSQAIGLCINLGAFALALRALPAFQHVSFVALAIGSCAALCVNFLSSKLYVFISRH